MKEFKMPTNLVVDDVYKERWLKAIDLPDDDLVVTISDVNDEVIGPEKEQKLILSFKEIEKQLVLNKSNATILKNQFSNRPRQWVGKMITLYATEVNFAGKVTLSIRIRLKGLAQTEPVPVQPPDHQVDELPW
jgi:hypothetical protein